MTLSVMAAPKRYAVGPYFLGAFPLGVISITWMGQPGGVWLLAAGSSNSKGLSFDAITGCSTIGRFDFDQLRDDFISPSSEEDPVQQIFRYVNDMRDGKYKIPKGRDTLRNSTIGAVSLARRTSQANQYLRGYSYVSRCSRARC
jgi:hypothetical protein